MPRSSIVRSAGWARRRWVLTVIGAATATLSANPAAAAGIISAVTTVSCSVTGANWCISGNNSSSGIGVIGTSKTGTGLRGTSTSQYGLKATSVSGTAILAQTTSGAQLSAGTATVRLDPAFAAPIDPHTPYRVFLTPGGDTHGLFVATKAAGGFIVRETEGGHSTLSFDYRIVATALGQSGRHMALVNAGSLGGIEPRAPIVIPPTLAPAANPPAPARVTPIGRPDASQP